MSEKCLQALLSTNSSSHAQAPSLKLFSNNLLAFFPLPFTVNRIVLRLFIHVLLHLPFYPSLFCNRSLFFPPHISFSFIQSRPLTDHFNVTVLQCFSLLIFLSQQLEVTCRPFMFPCPGRFTQTVLTYLLHSLFSFPRSSSLMFPCTGRVYLHCYAIVPTSLLLFSFPCSVQVLYTYSIVFFHRSLYLRCFSINLYS